MKIRLYNAYIITCNENFDIYKNGQVCIENGKIVFVGEKFDKFCADKEIDCNGDVLMPSFVLANVNMLMPVLGENAFKENFCNLICEYQDVLCQKLSYDEMYFSSLKTLYDLLKSGVSFVKTSFVEGSAVIDAILKSGVKALVGLKLNDELDEINRLKNIKAKIENFDFSNLKVGCFIDVKPWNCVRNFCYTDCAKIYKDYKVRATTFAQTTLDETGECDKQYLLTPIRFLEKEGFFDSPTIVQNPIYAEKEDLQILKQFDISACVDFSKNLLLGNGVFPFVSFLKSGVNVCLGAGFCSSSFDVFNELRLIKTVVSADLSKAFAVDDQTLLKLVTSNAAKALGVDDKVGKLEKFMCADLVRISCKNFGQIENKVFGVVNCATKNDIVFTMIDGNIMQLNEESIFSENYEKVNAKNFETATKVDKIFN